MIAINGNDNVQTCRLVDIMITYSKSLSRHILWNVYDMIKMPYQCIYLICPLILCYPLKRNIIILITIPLFFKFSQF